LEYKENIKENIKETISNHETPTDIFNFLSKSCWTVQLSFLLPYQHVQNSKYLFQTLIKKPKQIIVNIKIVFLKICLTFIFVCHSTYLLTPQNLKKKI
jgi:hypothetical protein